MSDETTPVERLDALEVRIANQEQIIDELSEVTARQWSEIEALNGQIDYLKSKLHVLEDGIKNPPDKEAPPLTFNSN